MKRLRLYADDLRAWLRATRLALGLVDRLYAIPDYGYCENYYQSDCRSQRRPRYGYGTADRWCFPCEVVAAVEGDPFDHDEDAKHDILGVPL